MPETKTAKNRLHLDLHPGPGRRDEEVTRLEGSARACCDGVREQGGEWCVMQDPEGNEFCVH